MDNSVWIAFAALIVAAGGPLLSSLITTSHESRMYNRRFYTEHKHQVIERYLQAVSKCLFMYEYSQGREEFAEFAACSSEIFMYIPKEHEQTIRELNNSVARYFSDSREQTLLEARSLYFSACEKLKDLGRKKHQGKRHLNK